MIKLAFYFTLIISISGFLLVAPASPTIWGFYSSILVVHILTGFGLLVLLVIVTFTHVSKGLRYMVKGRIHKKSYSGLGYFIVILIATVTGIFIGIRSGFAISWVVPLHLITGLWCFILSLKHSIKYKQQRARTISA